MNYSREAEDINLAYKVRHALNENLDTLSPEVSARLNLARNIALSRKKNDTPLQMINTQSVLAGNIGDFLSRPFSWLGRIGLALPLLVFIIGLIGIYEFEQQQHIFETAEIDAAVLSDELPLVAYLDHGFNAYLAKPEE